MGVSSDSFLLDFVELDLTRFEWSGLESLVGSVSGANLRFLTTCLEDPEMGVEAAAVLLLVEGYGWRMSVEYVANDSETYYVGLEQYVKFSINLTRR